MNKPLTAVLSIACAASFLGSSSAALATGGTVPGPVVYTESAAPSDSFADSVGFDAKFENHRYPARVTQELEWSGVRHLRDSGPVSQLMISTFANLGQHGIKHAIGMDRGFAPSVLITSLNAFEPYVDYVEPSNEADNYSNPDWAQMRQDQKNLYTTVRSNPAYANVAVMGPSFANPTTNAAIVGPLDAYEDFGQIHNATCDWAPSTTLYGSGILANIVKIRATTTYKPIMTTETGYGDDFSRGCSLPDQNIARYIPRESALRFMAGMQRTYYNSLVANPLDKIFGSLGLLNVDGSPRPQFLTLASLVHLTSDKGTPIAARQISYAVSGATADVDHLMLSRRDGSYELLIWREVASWDHHTRTEMAVAPENISVQLPSGAKYAGMFKVASNYGTTRTQLSVSSGVTASFPIDDNITVLHIYGGTASTAIRHT